MLILKICNFYTVKYLIYFGVYRSRLHTKVTPIGFLTLVFDGNVNFENM
jgi:hypothetical protein